MSCDIVRTSQTLCRKGGSGHSGWSSLGGGQTPYIITMSKMNISRTMTRKEPTKSTFTDSMDQMPTCGLLKSSVAICACLFGNMFVGKDKSPLGNYSKELKALEYFQNYALPTKLDQGESKKEALIVDDPAMKGDLQDRKMLIEKAENKMQQLAMRYRDSWDTYRVLMCENLDGSPIQDNVRKIQLLLSRVTKFLTFARGKLDTLKTRTLLELVEILDELEYVLKLTSDMRRERDTSTLNVHCTDKVQKDAQSNSLKSLGINNVESSKNKEFGGRTIASEGGQSQSNTSPLHRPGVFIPKVTDLEKELKKEDNIQLSVDKLGCGDVVKESTRYQSNASVNKLRTKQRSIYAGMKHPISRLETTADIEHRVKSTISHINALGRVDTKIDKTRLEKIFGKIGRLVTDRNIRKPTKTKLEQISREFVRIKDTIARLMKLNRGAKGTEDSAVVKRPPTNGLVLPMSGDNLNDLDSHQKGVIEYENKLEQLNKKLEEVRTAYDLLRTISINALSHQNKKSEVKRLMMDLNTITQELNRIQPSFIAAETETTVLMVQTTGNTTDVGGPRKTPDADNSIGWKADNENTNKRITIGIDTSETAGMNWPNPRYQSVLYNFDDEQSHTHFQANDPTAGTSVKTSKSKEESTPGEKGTQTRLDTISSWIEKHKAGEVLYEDSCIVTIGQPVRRTRSVNIINQESRKQAAQKLQCQSSESIIAPMKSKQPENCRNRFKELLKVGRGFFERSCKKNVEKAEAIVDKAQEIINEKPPSMGCSLEAEKGSESWKKTCCLSEMNDSERATKGSSSLSKGKLTMRNIQTSYDKFVVKPEVLCVDKVPNGGRSNFTCPEQDVRVKEAVENALAGIESAYSVALREFISILNTQGISVKMDSSSKSTSTTTLKPTSSRISRISIDSLSLNGRAPNRSGKRVPLPQSRSRLKAPDPALHPNSLVEYINTFDNSSLLLIQNNNFK